jgi:hypothetical protein
MHVIESAPVTDLSECKSTLWGPFAKSDGQRTQTVGADSMHGTRFYYDVRLNAEALTNTVREPSFRQPRIF